MRRVSVSDIFHVGCFKGYYIPHIHGGFFLLKGLFFPLLKL